MANEFNPEEATVEWYRAELERLKLSHEEEERICRLIKHHGGEFALKPTGEGVHIIIDFDDIVELIRAAKRQERADIILDPSRTPASR